MPPNSQAPKGTMANPWVTTYSGGDVGYVYRDDLGTWWEEIHHSDGTGYLSFTEGNPSFDSAGKPTWKDTQWHEVGPGTDYPDKEPMGHVHQGQEGENPPPLYESDQRPADGFDPNAPPLYESDPRPPDGFDPNEVGGVPPPPGDEGGIPGIGVPYQDYIPFWPMVQDPTTGEWRNAEPGEIPGVEGGDEAQLPPGSQTPESEPPLQPTPPGDDGGGIGIPYQDYIPFWPMVQDPTTGEWRNAEPGELEGSQSGDPSTPGSPQMLSNLFDLSTPGPTLDPNLFNPSVPGPTLDPRVVLDSDSPGPNIDPALLDPLAPGPTIDPALLDPNEPGPTVDPSLLDPLAPGETIDPAQLEHGVVEPSGGLEPASVTDHWGFTDPSLTESDHPEPSTPGHDFDDPSALG
jgi:hypothetical protein